MKIGILGNMNNMYFSLARFLADEGYDCELLLFNNEPPHFHPNADTFTDQIKLTIRQLTWGDPAHFFTKQKQVEKDLENYSFLIGNGPAPAFLNSIGRVLDLFIPYGEDLYAFPFPRLVHPLRQIPYLAMASHQKRGIQKCPCILFDKSNPGFDAVFSRLNYKGKRIICPPPLFYYKEYEVDVDLHEKNNPYYADLKKLRSENDLIVLQHIRQMWKKHRDKWQSKGNDQLIKGFAKFLKNNPGIKARLLLFEYGVDVIYTKTLITQLGLDSYVVWFPKTLRKHLMHFIKESDVVVGELHHSWNSYCVVFETLAMGKPFMHKRDDKYLLKDYPELYPMFYASSAETVNKGLQKVLDDKNETAAMVKKGKEWFLTYCVEKPIAEIKSIIEEKRKAYD